MEDHDSKPLVAIQIAPPQSLSPTEQIPLSPACKRGRKPVEIPDETRKEILRLHEFYSARQISPRVNASRKLVARVLQEHGLQSSPQRSPDTSKLEPFQDLIELRVRKSLTTTRILRELKDLGYKGGRTILGQRVRELQVKLTIEPKKAIKRRFETDLAEELQIDWSPYLVLVGGRTIRIHVLGCLLAWSRKLYVYAFRDERQSTLLQGLASAFVYFDGVAARTVLDNMATAVLGRFGPGSKPLWHPRFEQFTRHYGTVPFACRVRDPNRKGKKEKSFRLLEDDFLRASEFASMDDLNERLRIWLDQTPEVANLRVHGTTGKVPNEAFKLEHPRLIRLPEHRFPVYQDSVRVVDSDSTLSIRGTPYSVPSSLANRSVAVHLFAEHFEVLDSQGRVAFSRRYVADADKGHLVIDNTHYANLSRRPSSNSAGERLDEAFVRRFPDLRSLADGLKRRMKSLAPIHLRALLRLCDRYGEQAFLAAATRAQDFRRFDALAVERILERAHPATAAEMAVAQPVAPLSGQGAVALGEVECGSLDSFAALDAAAASTNDSDPKEGDPHGS